MGLSDALGRVVCGAFMASKLIPSKVSMRGCLALLLVAIAGCGAGSQQTKTQTGANPGDGMDPQAPGDATARGVVFTPQVIVGSNFGCWLKADKSVVCWGSLEKDPPTDKFTQIAAASFHACGTTVAGEAKCWGAHSAAPPGKFTQVAAGDHASCGIHADGELSCWGAKGNTEYAADLIEKCGSTEDHAECEEFSWLGMRLVMKRPRGKYKLVAVGGRHACALTVDGQAECWAPSEEDEDEAGAREVDDIALPAGKYRQITAGFLHTCGIRQAGGAAGKVVCAGGVEGQSEPGPSASTAVLVAAGVLNTCGVLADQSVVCWGSEESGATNAPSGEFVSVAAGLHVGCALPKGGAPVCWGDRDSSAAQPPK